jgi:hypothetical protein
MSFFLTSQFDDSFEWKGEVFHIDMSFDNILRLFEMFEDDLLMEIEKPFIAIQILIEEETENIFDSYDEVYELFKYLLKEFLDIDLDSKNDDDQTKIYDFKKDAEIIFASFYAEYNIDLLEMQGKLHWFKFLALLNNLDDESKFKQVIEIRTMKIPKESSQEYRDHVYRMKEIYSLDERSKEERVNNALDNMAMILKANAEGGA